MSEVIKPKTMVLNLTQMHPNSWNPNEMTEKTRAVLRRNMEKFGYRQHIIVRPSKKHPGQFEIVDGEHRYMALMDQGIDEVEVVVNELSDEDAMISTLAMNNVHGDLDPISMARMIADLNERGVGFDEIADYTNFGHEELEKFNELNMPPEENERERGDDSDDGVAPLEVVIALMEQGEEMWSQAMARAVKIMTSPDAIPLIGEQMQEWEEGIRRANRLSGAKSRSKALEFILRAFLAIPDEVAMRSVPSFPDGDPFESELTGGDEIEDNTPKKKKGKKKLTQSAGGDTIDDRLNFL